MLAASAHALLRARRTRIGPLLQTCEHVLELHHAGIGKHQGRVVARHQRRRRHDLVVVAGEKIEKAFADVVDAAHFKTVRAPLLLLAHDFFRKPVPVPDQVEDRLFGIRRALRGRKSPSRLNVFRRLFSGGGSVSLGRVGETVIPGRRAAANPESRTTACPGSGFRARPFGPSRNDGRPKNAFAPVLGGGRSTQPGADGGECLTHHSMIRVI